MVAVELLNDPSSLYTVDYVDNVDLSDTALVQTVRKALTSVQTGDSDLYNEIVEAMDMDIKDYYADPDSVAQLETVLKALSGYVACIDIYRSPSKSSFCVESIWTPCLNMLISNFLPPRWVINQLSHPRVLKKKIEVLSRVHAALLKISILVPLTPSRLVPMLSQKMPKIHRKDHLIVIYVESLLKLENSSIGRVGGSMILNVVMERLRDLDLEIGWDDIPQDDSSRGMFDMELEDAVEGTMNEGDELPVGPLNQDTSGESIVSELLQDIVVIHEAAASRKQRLTEGLWDVQFDSEYSDVEELESSSDRRRRRRNNRSNRKKSDLDDEEWDIFR